MKECREVLMEWKGEVRVRGGVACAVVSERSVVMRVKGMSVRCSGR